MPLVATLHSYRQHEGSWRSTLNPFDSQMLTSSGFPRVGGDSTIPSMTPLRPSDFIPRCTCRGRCRGHAIRKEKEKKIEQDLQAEEEVSWTFEAAWSARGGRNFDHDFRAPLDVPVDHPTYEQEQMRRRRMIYALNRVMKAREETQLAEYTARQRLLRCLENHASGIARQAFDRFCDAVRALEAHDAVVSLV